MVLKLWAEWIEAKSGEILLGGNVKLPPLVSPSITVSTDMTTVRTPTDFPWAQISESLKEKLGGSPYYLVDSSVECSVQIGKGLEKPMTYAWTINNNSIKGDGDKATITVATGLGIATKKTYATKPSQPETVSRSVQMEKLEFVPAIIVQETIQVTNKDGTKSSPYVWTSAVPGSTAPMNSEIEIKISGTDALSNKADCSKRINMKIFGDALQDFWEKERIKYEAAVPLEKTFPEPGPWLFAQAKLLPEHESIRFSRPELVLNIAGVKRISSTNVLRLPLEKTQTKGL